MLRPEAWGNLDNGALVTMLREAGVSVGSVWAVGSDGESASAKGIKRSSLDIAATDDEDPDGVTGDGVDDAGADVIDLTGRRET